MNGTAKQEGVLRTEKSCRSAEHQLSIRAIIRNSHTAGMAKAVNRWSDKVTKESNALDLQQGVFTWDDPKRIAESLRHSAEVSTRRKAEPYRSALSMLLFYMNRAGKNLPKARKDVLNKAKAELKKQFGKESAKKA